MISGGISDCHLHVIDPGRFPYLPGVGYTPRPGEEGTREDLAAVLDANGVGHALLIQPSCYGYENAAMIDAMAASPGRFKAIAVLAEGTTDREMQRLGDLGVVGIRFNLVNHDPASLSGVEGARLLGRLKDRGWFAQVYAQDSQWRAVAPALRQSGAQVLIDHFGVTDLAGSISSPGFAAVLGLGRTGKATVKLSAPFRIGCAAGRYRELDAYVEALLAAFGLDRCVWGSDWPFLAADRAIRYADQLAVLERWLPDPRDRDRVLRTNPARLFGFGR